MKYPNIEIERKRLGMTQVQFVSALGISHKSLNNWQRGQHPMPVDTLVAMARLFNCSADYLIGI